MLLSLCLVSCPSLFSSQSRFVSPQSQLLAFALETGFPSSSPIPILPIPSRPPGSFSSRAPATRRSSSTSRTEVQHWPLLPTPPATGGSQHHRPELTPTPAPRSMGPNPGTSARSIAQRAQRKREHQQRLSSNDGNIPPTPPPSNGRTRAGKLPLGDPPLSEYTNMQFLKGHRSLLHGHFTVSQLKSMTLDICQRCASTVTHSIGRQNASQN